MTGEIYRRAGAGQHPPNLHEPYRSTPLRAPRLAPLRLPHSLSELTGPLGESIVVAESDRDLTRQGTGAPLGERIVVHGRVLDEEGRAVPQALIEVWQCNAAGRYRHDGDQHDAPLDPNFVGGGRVRSDAEGRYEFITIKPGAYPWRNHPNAWRPAHIHFSLFGPAAATRLIMQMYFPGDPLLALDPIFNSVPDAAARARLVSTFDIEATRPEWALAYRFDVVLRGRHATPADPGHD
ncbi:MAG: protocatechuate 3,4-dioxygenase subunit beta [Alphaproteobacteria bacterium]|nr:protocatechuate 3,4-dioxygenase subunit beta [Alphaproteobacteria bacterium]